MVLILENVVEICFGTNLYIHEVDPGVWIKSVKRTMAKEVCVVLDQVIVPRSNGYGLIACECSGWFTQLTSILYGKIVPHY